MSTYGVVFDMADTLISQFLIEANFSHLVKELSPMYGDWGARPPQMVLMMSLMQKL